MAILIFLGWIVSISIFFFAEDTEAGRLPFDDCKLSKDQESVVRFSYEYGKPYGFGYTMVAIAMRESALGRYRINLTDPSAGVYHTTIDKGIAKLGWNENPFNNNRVAQKMIDDIHFAAEIALDTLIWWRGFHDGDWVKTVSGYNGGHNGNLDYVTIIVRNIEIIKRCGWLSEPSVVVYSD